MSLDKKYLSLNEYIVGFYFENLLPFDIKYVTDLTFKITFFI